MEGGEHRGQNDRGGGLQGFPGCDECSPAKDQRIWLDMATDPG